jgi:hypothetical protein
VLYIHEVHEVIGRHEDDFEAGLRDEWMPMLAEGDDARLLWFCEHVHGTGPAYNVVTLTAVRDGAAWERLARRLQTGDLKDWQTQLDGLRHRVTAKLMVPVPWSPLQAVDFASVPTTPQDRDPVIYMEDTGWPHASLADYVDFWESGYYQPMEQRPKDGRLIDIELVFQPAYGGGTRKEAVLWQRILDNNLLHNLLVRQTPKDLKAPGMFMHEALAYRDTWNSRLLRTSRWAPL